MSSVDQLFDRFGDLLKSWIRTDAPSERPFADPGGEPRRQRSGDPFFDEAMEELDAFLDDDKEAQERLRREQDSRRRASEAPYRPARPSGPPPKLAAAYRILGLEYGASFLEAKAAYKRLLKEHHPDMHGSTSDGQKKATETATKMNDAFRIIETWHETGTLGDE